MSITLNFYDEVKNIAKCNTLESLKQQIAFLYLLDPVDVEELIIKYDDEEKDVITITSEEDYTHAKQMKDLIINLEISDKSRLFKTQLELKKVNSSKSTNSNSVDKKNEILLESKSESLKEDIERRKRELEALLLEEKRLVEERLIEEEMKRKLLEEDNRKKLEEERAKLEKEELIKEEQVQEQKKKQKAEEEEIKIKEEQKLKEEELFKKKIFQDIVEATVSKKLKSLKKKLIAETVKSTVSQYNDIFGNISNTEVKGVKIEEEKLSIHYGVVCDGCSQRNISGIRYKCTVCHDFDYCEKCEESNHKIHEHSFIKIRKPEANCGFGPSFFPHCNKFGPFRKYKHEKMQKKHEKHSQKEIKENFAEKLIKTLGDTFKNIKSDFNNKIVFDKLFTCCNIEPNDMINKKEKVVDDDIKIEDINEVDINKVEEKEDLQDESYTAIFEIQAEEIENNYKLNGITRKEIVEALKKNKGDYEKTVSELYDNNSVLYH